MLLEKEGVEIAFDSLSGGEQAFFLLAADLARRLMIESPNTPLAETPGIVCIDEIELHLHPAWQRRILKGLMKTFPACQFVVSTHSPQVIAGVEARHIRLLEPGENGVRKVSQPIASKGHDSNYVLKGILDTPDRDDEVVSSSSSSTAWPTTAISSKRNVCWTTLSRPSRVNPRQSRSGKPS